MDSWDEFKIDAQWEYDKLRNGIWTTNNGEEIHINDLSDGHLKNIINMLEKQGGEWLAVMKEEQIRRMGYGTG